MTAPETDGHNVSTTEKSIRILEEICEQNGARLSEICSALGLSKSSVYNHLQTLLKTGFVVKEGDRYCISLRMLWFAEHADLRKPEYHSVKKEVDELAKETGEEVTFAVEENNRVIVYYNAMPTGMMNPTFRRGKRAYMHNSAVGKAMLAEGSDEKIEQVLDQWGLPGVTDETIMSRETFYEEIERVRDQGYAMLDEEFAEGLISAAVAVTGPNDSVVGSLSIIVPKYRVSIDELHNKIVPKIQTKAEGLEQQIGTE